MKRPRTIASLYARFPEDHRDTARIAATVTGFRQRFGHWPTLLRMDASQHQGITAMLTRAAMSDLDRRVRVIPAPDFPGLVAEDEAGNQWSYGDIPASLDDAYQWLWGVNP